MSKNDTHLLLGLVILIISGIIAIFVNIWVYPDKKQGNEVVINEDTSNFTGAFALSSGINGTLFLRKDNTFRLSITDGSQLNYVGNYSVKSNSITLDSKVLYDSSGCYYLEGSFTNNISANIMDKNTLEIVYSGNAYNAARDDYASETITSINNYSLSPTDSNSRRNCSN